MKLAAGAVGLVLIIAVEPVGAASVPPSEPTTTTENPFLPKNENVTDCISALPKPGCGSPERGEPIQFAVFGVLAASLTLIGWRITRAIRARDRALTPQQD